MQERSQWRRRKAAIIMHAPRTHVHRQGKTKLLFLVSLDCVAKVLKWNASKVNTKQGHDLTYIFGRAYYTLQCEIIYSKRSHNLLTGLKDTLYSEEDFKIGFETGMGGLQLKSLYTDIHHTLT